MLDGKGHTVSGLSLRGDAGNTAYEVGLFGVVDRGVVRNLIVEGARADVHNETYGNVGIIAGSLKNGLLAYCAVLGGAIKADIGVDSSAGGLVGLNRGTIRYCFNSCDVTIYTGIYETGNAKCCFPYAGRG